MARRPTPDEISHALFLYSDCGYSFDKAGAEIGVSGTAIRNHAKKQGVTSRSLSEAKRTVACDHEYFSGDLNEEKAYWIGFILADGCLTDKKYGVTQRLTVRLAACDLGHLVKLRESLGSDHTISTVEDGRSCQFSVSSSEMFNDLCFYGCTPNKSATQKVSKNIPDNMLKHFYRGYFDGNGSISPHKASKWSVNCVSSESFLTSFRDWVSSQIGGNPARIGFSYGIHRIAWSGTHRCREILDLIYKDAVIYLDRKMDKYLQIVRDSDSSPRGAYNRK